METEIKTEGEVIDTINDNGEGTTEEESISIPKKDYENLNQTLGSLKREIKDLRKLKKTQEEEPETPNKPQSNDLGEKAFLIANGIKGKEEMEFFNKMKKETGKDAESLLETTYFQAELREFREKRASDLATPKGSPRSNNSSVDTVEYWIAKGELPPNTPDNKKLREDVVNARMKKEESRGVFYNS